MRAALDHSGEQHHGTQQADQQRDDEGPVELAQLADGPP